MNEEKRLRLDVIRDTIAKGLPVPRPDLLFLLEQLDKALLEQLDKARDVPEPQFIDAYRAREKLRRLSDLDWLAVYDAFREEIRIQSAASLRGRL